MITEENGGMRAYPLFPFDPVRNVEAFYIEFDAGVEEYVFLVQGTLKIMSLEFIREQMPKDMEEVDESLKERVKAPYRN